MRTILSAVVLVTVTAGSAHATPGECQRALVKESAKYTQAAMRLRQKCEDAKVTGFVPSDFDCQDGLFATTKLNGFRDKLRQHIASACGGGNHSCSAGDIGNDADEALASIGWDVGACPDFEGRGCTNQIADCSDIAACILCVSDAAQLQALGLYYDALHVPADDHALEKCQRTLGARAEFFFSQKTKALQTCERKVLSGSLPGPCPDPKTQQKIDTLEQKVTTAICRDCGGDDRVCGGADDRTKDEIGFTSECPNVTIPGGASCGDDAIDSLDDIVACVACVTEFKVDCVDRLAMPSPEDLTGVGRYPAECN